MSLKPSTPDDVQLCLAVESRFLDLCNLHKRIRGTDLIFPVSLESDVRRWRTMKVRHDQKDYRHRRSELRSLRAIAEWTIEINCVLRNVPIKKLEWVD